MECSCIGVLSSSTLLCLEWLVWGPCQNGSRRTTRCPNGQPFGTLRPKTEAQPTAPRTLKCFTPVPHPPRSHQDVAHPQPPSHPFSQQILRKAAKQAEEQASLKRSVPSAGGAAGAAGVYGPGAGAAAAAAAASTTPRVGGGAGSVRKKRRWDDGTPAASSGGGDETPAAKAAVSDWDADVATPVRSRSFGGGETPGRTPGGGGETPGRSRWDQTPSRDAQETPVARRSSRWDQSGGVTPVAGGITPGMTPGGVGDTPKAGSKWDDETPRAGGFGAGETPSGRKKSRWDQVGFRRPLLVARWVYVFVRLLLLWSYGF